ncbi:MAG TPA: class F sortase [Candidatus Sulfotelmatobacter sp.]|nr:class F sortase [Candidatus Sulfotelmatobacter sp.]
MSDTAKIGLDNPAFYGRLKRPDFSHALPRSSPSYKRRPLTRPARTEQAAAKLTPSPKVIQVPQVSFVPTAQIGPHVHHKSLKKPRYSKTQLVLLSLACLVLLIGMAVSIQTFITNKNAVAQINKLSKQVDSQNSGSSAVPSTSKPSSSAIANYAVAAGLPRYIRIPAIGVFARVLQVGVTPSGVLATPPDIYDSAWYTGSAKPGQPGATLIDGHISSWTSEGVFYNLKKLVPGDSIQIQKGDNTLVNYQVVKTVIYNSNSVDMQAALTPVTPNVSGLNLISCTGQVIKGTSTFNKRVIVFAQETS